MAMRKFFNLLDKVSNVLPLSFRCCSNTELASFFLTLAAAVASLISSKSFLCSVTARIEQALLAPCGGRAAAESRLDGGENCFVRRCEEAEDERTSFFDYKKIQRD